MIDMKDIKKIKDGVIYLDNYGWGLIVSYCIDEAIEFAKESGCLVEFEFNGVNVRVSSESNSDCILRDWDRGLRGYLGKNPTVGPYPLPPDPENDARIQAEKDRQREIDDQERAEKERAKKEALTTRLALAPELDVTEEWATFVEINSKDPYSNCIVKYAEKWGRLMQLDISEGKPLEESAGSTSHEADDEGITGFMYGCAVAALSRAWVHGEALRDWHNKQYGVESKGVVNPAILKIKGE